MDEPRESITPSTIDCRAFYDDLKAQHWVSSQSQGLPATITSNQALFLESMLFASGVAATLDETRLNSLLADILEPDRTSSVEKWWKAFQDWLKGLLSKENEAHFGWLVKLLQAIAPSTQTARTLLYVAYTLTISAAVGLVLHELYLSGFFSRFEFPRRRQQVTLDNLTLPEPHENAVDPDILPPSRQIAFWLARCIETLSKRGEMPENPALTNRELRQWLRHHQTRSADAFSLLTELAEPVLYGDEIPSRHLLTQFRQQAELILAP
ncbi:MAG: DUF4129 domain-containing protein [Gammaproteobacteria bacterium]